MLSTRIRGVSPFNGYRVTCFTNEEEEAVGVASKATWLLETELKEKIGVIFSRGEIWKPYMVEDRNLVTGQNPHSAAVLGRRLLEVLDGVSEETAHNKRPLAVRGAHKSITTSPIGREQQTSRLLPAGLSSGSGS